MAWCVPLGFLYELFWRLLAARDQQHLMLRAQVVMAGVRLAGGYLLISWLTSTGAAINLCAALLLHNLLLAHYARLDGTRLGLCRVGWRLLVATLAMAVVVALLLGHSDLWVVIPVAAVLYAAMVLLLKGLSAGDFSVFREIREAGSE
jgi:O-antigen/teichoic acid export membrane protein